MLQVIPPAPASAPDSPDTAPVVRIRQGAKCCNAEPGTFGHECGRPAVVAITRWVEAWCSYPAKWYTGHYCAECYARGTEAARARRLAARTDWL